MTILIAGFCILVSIILAFVYLDSSSWGVGGAGEGIRLGLKNLGFRLHRASQLSLSYEQ